jgi:hypothetical protein
MNNEQQQRTKTEAATDAAIITAERIRGCERRWPVSLHRCAWPGCRGVVVVAREDQWTRELETPGVWCFRCGDAYCDREKHGEQCSHALCHEKEWYCDSCRDHLLQHYDELDAEANAELDVILRDWCMPNPS